MKRKKGLAILLSLVLLVGCGANETDDSLVPTEDSLNRGHTSQIKYLSPDYTFGGGNEKGYYYLTYNDDGSSLLRYIDYTTKQDIPLCSQPNCAHDNEKCSAWFPYTGTTANVFATNDSIYIVFNGAPWDHSAFETYGEQALPRVLTCDLDGSKRKEIARFGASDAVVSLPASDGQFLYTVITSYDDAAGTGTNKIATIDLKDGTQNFDESIQRNELRIVGASGRELVLESRVSADSNAYAAYNVDTKQLREIYNGNGVCRKDVCCIFEPETGAIHQVGLEDGNEVTLSTDLLSRYQAENLQLVYVTQQGYVIQGKDGETYCNFLVDKNGKATKQELWVESTDSHDKMRMMNIFAEQGDNYLIAPNRSFHEVSVPGPNGVTYGVDEVVYSFALISQEDFWNSVANYAPISRLE